MSMQSPSAPLLAAVLLSFIPTAVRAGEATLTLSSAAGASIRFIQQGETWRWAGLTTPNSPNESALNEEKTALAVKGVDDVLEAGWELAEQDPIKLVFEQNAGAADLRFRRIFSFGPARNVLRIETWVRASGTEKVLTRAGLLDLRIDDEKFLETGPAPSSFPLFGRSLFVGIEHVSGICRAEGDVAHLWQTPHLKVKDAWMFVAAAVVGWPSPSDCSLIPADARVREGFLQYLDAIRLKPADF